jgi:hypothetical protein
VVSNLLNDADKGDTKIVVEKQASFAIGQTIEIDPGRKNEETAEVVEFGSLVLKKPLQHKHLKNAIVRGLPIVTTTPKATQTMTPASKFARDEAQQQVAGVPNLLLMVGLFVSAAVIALVFRSARKTRESREILIPFASDSEEGPVE